MNDSDRGLYGKYVVNRTDGSSERGEKHEHCEYFVLDLVHDKLALGALETYARAAESEFPQLADDLYDKLAKLNPYRGCVPPFGGQGASCARAGVIPLGNGCLFCVEHAREFERVAHPLGEYARGSIARRLAKSDGHRDPHASEKTK